MTDLLKIAGDALPRIAIGNLLHIAMTISRLSLIHIYIGLTLEHAAAIDAYEAKTPSWKPAINGV